MDTQKADVLGMLWSPEDATAETFYRKGYFDGFCAAMDAFRYHSRKQVEAFCEDCLWEWALCGLPAECKEPPLLGGARGNFRNSVG